jgi:hypothetical protein
MKTITLPLILLAVLILQAFPATIIPKPLCATPTPTPSNFIRTLQITNNYNSTVTVTVEFKSGTTGTYNVNLNKTIIIEKSLGAFNNDHIEYW